MLGVVALLIHYPQLDYWPLVVQGDLSRDLYVYHRTLLGELPYRDYFYNYGPFMPFYYALFYMFFGVEFPSIIIGFMLLNIISGTMIYLILKKLTTGAMALLGAGWFWLFYDKITFSFNHCGAVPLILLNVYLIFIYHDFPRKRIFLGVAATIFLLFLIKINIGLSVLVSSFFSIALFRKEKKPEGPFIINTLLILLFLSIVLAVCVYSLLLMGLPDYYLKQCFPLSASYIQVSPDLSLFIKHLCGMAYAHFMGLESRLMPNSIFSNIWAERLFILSFLCFFIDFCLRFFKKNINNKYFLIFLLFIIFLSHEFIVLGVLYELWLPAPVFICVFFLLAWEFLRKYIVFRYIWFFIMSVVMVMTLLGGYVFKNRLIASNKYFLPFDKMNIYSLNPPNWTLAVEETTNYLKANIMPGEKFLAVPYEPIYYWLLERRSPVVETMFFDFVNIPIEQEKRIIRDLEKEQVNYIVMSNRVHSPEAGLGRFGVTNCKMLGSYIDHNFTPIIIFGKWENPAIWSWDHAIKIYRRNTLGRLR